MNNEIANELNRYRGDRLQNWSLNQINADVHAAMERLSPGSLNGLMGVDAHSDGITAVSWQNAVTSAESCAAVIFGYAAMDPVMPEDPVEFSEAVEYVADRVAESILTLHGYESVRKRPKTTVELTTTLPEGERFIAATSLVRENNNTSIFVITESENGWTLWEDGEADQTWSYSFQAWREMLRATGWDYTVRTDES